MCLCVYNKHCWEWRKWCVISCWPLGAVCWRVICKSKKEMGVAWCALHPARLGRAEGLILCSSAHLHRRHPGWAQSPGAALAPETVPSSRSLPDPGQRWEQPRAVPAALCRVHGKLLQPSGSLSYQGHSPNSQAADSVIITLQHAENSCSFPSVSWAPCFLAAQLGWHRWGLQ